MNSTDDRKGEAAGSTSVFQEYSRCTCSGFKFLVELPRKGEKSQDSIKNHSCTSHLRFSFPLLNYVSDTERAKSNGVKKPKKGH